MVWFLDGDKEWTHQIIPKMKIFVDRKFENAFFHEMKFLQKKSKQEYVFEEKHENTFSAKNKNSRFPLKHMKLCFLQNCKLVS